MKNRGIHIGKARASFLTIFSLGLGFSLSGQTVLEKEEANRKGRVIAADEALSAGDEAYLSSDFEEAVIKYREAFALVPEGEKTAKYREATRERYAQAAVQAAKVRNRQGDRAGALEMVNEVLGKNAHPDYFPAQKLKSQLDDPIKTNPVATKEFAQKVDEVRRLLYQARGFYDLGDFDRAIGTYQKVLRIDSYNKAARRGMAEAQRQISDYANAARDHTRAEFLKQVDAGWQLPEPNQDLGNLEVLGNGLVIDPSNDLGISDKLDDIILPQIVFDENTIEEALEILGGLSRQLDPDVIEDRKGISFVLNVGSGNSPEIDALLEKRFSFRLTNVPLREVLKYATSQTGMDFRVDSFAVVVFPLNGSTDDLVVRRYQVPPGFLDQTSAGAAVEDDPFAAEENTNKVTLAPRLTAEQYLKEQGVDFPEGASATYNANLGELIVKTTSTGHNYVRSLVETLVLEEPFAVIIETKIIRIEQENLAELGFDVSLSQLAQSGDVILGGGTLGNGAPGAFTGDPVTAGLRSGDFAFPGNSLDALIESETTQPIGGEVAAPGVVSLLGVGNDFAFSTLLRGLNQKSGADLMTQPSVVTRSGQQAVIESGQNFTYPGEYEPPELPNNVGATTIDPVTGQGVSTSSFPVTPAHPTDFQTRFLGTTLEVQPVVSEDRKTAEVTFNLEVDEFLGFINYGSPITGGSSATVFGAAGFTQASTVGEITSNDILVPIFDRVGLNTKLEIATGQTIIAGGLVSETVEDVQDKVPILGDIPLLGRLFQSNGVRREKEVLLVFVTVRIVDPGGKPVQN